MTEDYYCHNCGESVEHFQHTVFQIFDYHNQSFIWHNVFVCEECGKNLNSEWDSIIKEMKKKYQVYKNVNTEAGCHCAHCKVTNARYSFLEISSPYDGEAKDYDIYLCHICEYRFKKKWDRAIKKLVKKYKKWEEII